MAQLRSSIYIDQLQPQTHAMLCTQLRGDLPRARMAVQILDLTPSTDVDYLTDRLVKGEDVSPGLSAVEATFGFMEFHSTNPSSVRSAANAALAAAGLNEADAPAAEVLASHFIDRLDDAQVNNINKAKNGSPVLANEALYILQTQPATVALLAANEAEKSAAVKLVSMTFTGGRGRLYLSGCAEAVRAAAAAAEQAVQA